MDLIKSTTSVANRPAPVTTGFAGWAARSSATGGTIITADVINSILAELKNLIEAAGLPLTVSDDTLVEQAVKILSIPQGYTYNSNSGGSFTIDALNLNANTADFTTINCDSINVSPISGNGKIEIGKRGGTATTPYIDFHSGSVDIDYDARISAQGGTGVVGGGDLLIQANNLYRNDLGVNTRIDSFPAGTKLLFYQSFAPTNWTKVTLSNDYVIVTGAGGTSGGVAGSNIVTGCNIVVSHTHSVDPATVTVTTSSDAHSHTVQDAYYTEKSTDMPIGGNVIARGFTGTGSAATDSDNNALYTRTVTTSSDTHNHTASVNIPATNTGAPTNIGVWKPLYYTVIIAQKDT